MYYAGSHQNKQWNPYLAEHPILAGSLLQLLHFKSEAPLKLLYTNYYNHTTYALYTNWLSLYGNCMHMSGTNTDWRTEREQQLSGHLHWWFQQPHCLTSFTDEHSNWLGLFNMQYRLFYRLLTVTLEKWTYRSTRTKPTTIKWLKNQLKFSPKGLFTWKWGTPGWWGNPLRWGNPPVHTISCFNLIMFTW